MRRKKTTVSRQADDVKPIAMTPNVELQLQTINTYSKKIYAKLRPDQQNKKPTHTKPLHDQARFRDNTFKAHITCYRNKRQASTLWQPKQQWTENKNKKQKTHTHTHNAVHKPSSTVTDQNNTAVQAETTDEKATNKMGVELFNKDQLRVESRGYIRN
jgi:hypothetical protein